MFLRISSRKGTTPMHLKLNESEFSVTAEGTTIQLFAKEFALLQFLYLNQGHAFSREQLLDKVWQGEHPTDRTVDDHIYRLRKKLSPLSGVEIVTIRSFGYSLRVHGLHNAQNLKPTLQDSELNAAMRDVFAKYHQYGQGKSMLALADQQDLLGYEVDKFYAVYIHFVQGDLQWLLYTKDVEINERLYWLLLIYMYLSEPEKALHYCELALKKKVLLPSQHLELEILNIIDLYALTGKKDEALKRLEITYRYCEQPEMSNFYLSTAITEMYVHLLFEHPNEFRLSQLSEEIEQLLLEKPYLRETGSFQVIKGLSLFKQKQWETGELLVDKGLQIMELSGFVPLYYFALYRVYHYTSRFSVKGNLQKKYAGLYEAAKHKRDYTALLPQLKEKIYRMLGRV